jgi:hypothetical protein
VKQPTPDTTQTPEPTPRRRTVKDLTLKVNSRIRAGARSESLRG